jgi:hypothetical protein
LRQAIAYYYLLSFAAPDRIGGFAAAAADLRQRLAEESGMEEEFFAAAIPEVCRRIVAFHQDTREPDNAVVDSLVRAARTADRDAAGLAAFQAGMRRIAALPARANKGNRLHADRGCALCAVPCRYGFFTLVTKPDIALLQAVMEAETAKPAAEQSPLGLVHGFAETQIARIVGPRTDWITAADLADLSYCLLLLGMAKSRLAPPEAQLRLFQAANQEFIRRGGAGAPPP